MTASEAVEAVKGKKIKARELTEAVLARVNDTDDQIKAFVTVTAEKALAQADVIDQNISAHDDCPPLAGVPIALKDNLCLEGVPAAAGSRSIASFPAPYSAAVVEKSVKAGGVIVGKTNMDEFGMDGMAETSPYPASRNPWDLKRSAGDGSAAAVASGQAMLGLASDSGGSARISASYCGVAGFRPTPGLISRYGLISAASSMSQPGFIAKSAADFNLIIDPLYGFDPRDSSTIFAREQALKTEGQVTRIGLPEHIFDEAKDLPEAVIDEIRNKISSLGPEIVEVSLPHFATALLAYYIIVIAESFSNLSRYDGIRYGYSVEDDNLEEWYQQTRDQGIGEEAKRRSILGAYLLNKDNFEKYYEQALRVWSLTKEDFTEALHRCDLIVLPVACSQAPLLGEKRSFTGNYQRDEFCAPVSMAGLPSVSIPALEIEGMPLGIQLVGAPFADRMLIKFAAVMEQEISI